MLPIEPPRASNSCFASSLKGLILACVLVLAGCNEEALYSMLDETQANEVQAALLRERIDARKVAAQDGEHWMVTVDRAAIPAAMAILREQGLPRTRTTSIGQVFEKKGFVSSPLEERARYHYALSQELAGTLMEIDGVVSARVHVALPEAQVLDENQDSASVSVVMIQEPDVDLSPYETDIKAIVTDGIEGLDDVNRVTVKFFNRRESPPIPEPPGPEDTLTIETWVVWSGVAGAFGVCLLAILVTARVRRPARVPAPSVMESRS